MLDVGGTSITSSILDVDTCLSTKFQGGANQIQGGGKCPPPPPPPKINAALNPIYTHGIALSKHSNSHNTQYVQLIQ